VKKQLKIRKQEFTAEFRELAVKRTPIQDLE
jgi:hypothetical protein